MDKATTYELLSLASLLLFALFVWPPAALLVAGLALAVMAWVEVGAPLPERKERGE